MGGGETVSYNSYQAFVSFSLVRVSISLSQSVKFFGSPLRNLLALAVSPLGPAAVLKNKALIQFRRCGVVRERVSSASYNAKRMYGVFYILLQLF